MRLPSYCLNLLLNYFRRIVRNRSNEKYQRHQKAALKGTALPQSPKLDISCAKPCLDGSEPHVIGTVTINEPHHDDKMKLGYKFVILPTVQLNNNLPMHICLVIIIVSKAI